MTTWISEGAEQTRELGRRLGRMLRAGDLVLLHGDLGAGKTTFTQGLAEALGVRGPVVSPTFIVARIHESAGDGPDLIHVDAYRIQDELDLETLDLDTSLADSVTVVEWGAGKAEVLSEDRLEIDFLAEAATQDWTVAADERRVLTLKPVGADWAERLAKEN
ncbi:tRNA (adenosine(37)-N6)-threonylcarbamoyltransferase complex ATPase subunit type 1 TsaE [Scrofimicrobium sp. R131]|uniref:tRNA threonylcarbamoyladenosine biosynthesis protein TsaE n=1 Tax=Scrofimicrobium appendicitidis TaxID=3079930 RepID=A0AAU7V6J1_9ACTO